MITAYSAVDEAKSTWQQLNCSQEPSKQKSHRDSSEPDPSQHEQPPAAFSTPRSVSRSASGIPRNPTGEVPAANLATGGASFESPLEWPPRPTDCWPTYLDSANNPISQPHVSGLAHPLSRLIFSSLIKDNAGSVDNPRIPPTENVPWQIPSQTGSKDHPDPLRIGPDEPVAYAADSREKATLGSNPSSNPTSSPYPEPLLDFQKLDERRRSCTPSHRDANESATLNNGNHHKIPPIEPAAYFSPPLSEDLDVGALSVPARLPCIGSYSDVKTDFKGLELLCENVATSIVEKLKTFPKIDNRPPPTHDLSPFSRSDDLQPFLGLESQPVHQHNPMYDHSLGPAASLELSAQGGGVPPEQSLSLSPVQLRQTAPFSAESDEFCPDLHINFSNRNPFWPINSGWETTTDRTASMLAELNPPSQFINWDGAAAACVEPSDFLPFDGLTLPGYSQAKLEHVFGRHNNQAQPFLNPSTWVESQQVPNLRTTFPDHTNIQPGPLTRDSHTNIEQTTGTALPDYEVDGLSALPAHRSNSVSSNLAQQKTQCGTTERVLRSVTPLSFLQNNQGDTTTTNTYPYGSSIFPDTTTASTMCQLDLNSIFGSSGVVPGPGPDVPNSDPEHELQWTFLKELLSQPSGPNKGTSSGATLLQTRSDQTTSRQLESSSLRSSPPDNTGETQLHSQGGTFLPPQTTSGGPAQQDNSPIVELLRQLQQNRGGGDFLSSVDLAHGSAPGRLLRNHLAQGGKDSLEFTPDKNEDVPITDNNDASTAVTPRRAPDGSVSNDWAADPAKLVDKDDSTAPTAVAALSAASTVADFSGAVPLGQEATLSSIARVSSETTSSSISVYACPAANAGTLRSSRPNSISSSTGTLLSASSLAELQGQVLALAKVQYGSRLLQRLLNRGESTCVELVLNETVDHLASLMVDPYGNYLCQHLFEVCSHDQRLTMLRALCNDAVQIAEDRRGTHSIQALIALMKTEEEQLLLMSPLQSEILRLSIHPHGTHVIQRALTCCGEKVKAVIFTPVIKCLDDVARNPHGICVVKKCISTCTPMPNYTEFESMLLDRLTRCAMSLIQSPYGNYAVQHALERWGAERCKQIVTQVRENFTLLSTQKFSSNVVEKTIDVISDEGVREFVETALRPPTICALINSGYGNFVTLKLVNRMNNSEATKLLQILLGTSVNALQNKRLKTKWDVIVHTVSSANNRMISAGHVCTPSFLLHAAYFTSGTRRHGGWFQNVKRVVDFWCSLKPRLGLHRASRIYEKHRNQMYYYPYLRALVCHHKLVQSSSLNDIHMSQRNTSIISWECFDSVEVLHIFCSL